MSCQRQVVKTPCESEPLGRSMRASATQSQRRTSWKRAAGAAGPSAEAGRTAAAATALGISVQANAPAHGKAVLPAGVPGQC